MNVRDVRVKLADLDQDAELLAYDPHSGDTFVIDLVEDDDGPVLKLDRAYGER